MTGKSPGRRCRYRITEDSGNRRTDHLPDGLAYAPKQNKVFVSDEHGGVDAVIDATSNKLIANIPLGGGAGNTVYDAVSGHILVAVHGVNLLAVIDPATNQIVSRILRCSGQKSAWDSPRHG